MMGWDRTVDLLINHIYSVYTNTNHKMCTTSWICTNYLQFAVLYSFDFIITGVTVKWTPPDF